MVREKKDYSDIKRQAAETSRDRSLEGRDIGTIPPCKNPKRRAKCAKSLRIFLEKYFPRIFCEAWSDDHLKVIGDMEEVIWNGGQMRLAMPRASGKTSITMGAVLWALFNNYRKFVMLLSATDGESIKLFRDLETCVTGNMKELADDFPEIIYPFKCLEGIANRQKGQLHNGKNTNIICKSGEIAFPNIDGFANGGAVVRTAGLTAAWRGAHYINDLGEWVRPDLAICDDPSTRATAKSKPANDERMRLLNADMIPLAGPTKRIAAIVPCTIIEKDDVADRLFDPRENPLWTGRKMKAIYKFPKRMDMWEKYADLLNEAALNDQTPKKAQAWYRKNKKKMKEGAKLGWPSRKKEGFVDGLEELMRIFLLDRETFFSEYQNDPLEAMDSPNSVTKELILTKLNSIPKKIVPMEATHLTASVDVHATFLSWLVMALQEDFTCHVVGYGRLGTALRPLQKLTKTNDDAGAVYQGLEMLSKELLGTPWRNEQGEESMVECCLVDSGWNAQTVYQWTQRNEYNRLTHAVKGWASSTGASLMNRKREPGERVGLEWRHGRVKNNRGVNLLTYDSNFWKSFFHDRIRIPIGSPGALSLFGKRPAEHRILAEEWTAESYTEHFSKKRGMYTVWEPKPNRENHLLDNAANCCLAGSFVGLTVPGQETKKKAKGSAKGGETWAEKAKKRYAARR